MEGADSVKKIEKFKKKYAGSEKFTKATFSDGNIYNADSIDAVKSYIAKTPSLKPRELMIKTTQGSIENEFSLILNSNAGEGDSELEYRIKCIDDEIQGEIKVLIDKWVRENRPNKFLQLWINKIVVFVWLFGFLAVIVSGLSINETVSYDDNFKGELKKSAYNLIERGISNENLDSAINLILQIQSEYVPKEIKKETVTVQNFVALKVFIVSLIILIISLIRPKTVIGLGRQSTVLIIYKFWGKTIKYVLTAIFIAVIYDVIKAFLFDY